MAMMPFTVHRCVRCKQEIDFKVVTDHGGVCLWCRREARKANELAHAKDAPKEGKHADNSRS